MHPSQAMRSTDCTLFEIHRLSLSLIVSLELEGVGMSVEVDTGAFVSVVSEDHLKSCKKMAPHYVLQESS